MALGPTLDQNIAAGPVKDLEQLAQTLPLSDLSTYSAAQTLTAYWVADRAKESGIPRHGQAKGPVFR